MDGRRRTAIRQCHPSLRTGINVSQLLPRLHIDAGGFLTDVENANISDQKICGNVKQVDELIDVLLKKQNRDFDYFCDVLEKEGFKAVSKELKGAAGVGKHCSYYISTYVVRRATVRTLGAVRCKCTVS